MEDTHVHGMPQQEEASLPNWLPLANVTQGTQGVDGSLSLDISCEFSMRMGEIIDARAFEGDMLRRTVERERHLQQDMTTELYRAIARHEQAITTAANTEYANGM